MTQTVHRIYIAMMILIVVLVFLVLAVKGASYYSTSLENRFFHEDHSIFKPNGLIGHGIGILGSFFIVTGVGLYMARKRYRRLSRLGLIKHWLEFHIFLCTLGPVLILFHTAFKFGGIVSISFWSMVAVVASGVIGRFIYIQIPRTIEGRELNLHEVKEMKSSISGKLQSSVNLDDDKLRMIEESAEMGSGAHHRIFLLEMLFRFTNDMKTIRNTSAMLKKSDVPKRDRKEILKLIKHEISLNRKIDWLLRMQKLFRYWHIGHLPFALIMLVIMVLHIGIALAFGYKWIF